jgi:hypothetical protein
MSETHTFRAVIEDAGGGGMFVRVPFDVEAAFGKKRVPVQATIDGQPYRGTLVRMGEPCHMLPVLKEIRGRIGKGAGDEVEITLREDTAPRVVEIPADLGAALAKSPPAQAAFQKLSYTHQREYLNWILDAKRPETRQRRIAQTLERLGRND